MRPSAVIFGLKSVWRRKTKNLFAILAITLGVSLLAGITVSADSLSNGFAIFFSQSLGERDGSITHDDGFFNQTIYTNLTQLNLGDDVEAISAELVTYVTISTKAGLISTQTPLMGVDPDDDQFGKFFSLDGDELAVGNLAVDEVYIGEFLANNLEVGVGDTILYSLSLGPQPIEQNLTIKAIVAPEERGNNAGNSALYYNLPHLQSSLQPLTMFGLPADPISRINVRFSDSVENQTTAMRELKTTIAAGWPDLDVNDLNFVPERDQIFEVAETLAEALNQVMTIFGFILIFAGLLLITNIQLMSVEERETQTGIMRAVGTKRLQVILANLTEFIITGVVGGLFGVVGAMGLAKVLIIAFGNAFEFDGNIIPIVVTPGTIIVSFMAGFLLSLITGLVPAIRASRIDIVETLRGITNEGEPEERGSGTSGLILGFVLTALGLLMLTGVGKMPWDMPNAYKDLGDAEALYLPTMFILIGVLVLLSFFVSRDLTLNLAALVLILLPLFNIFVVFDWIETGSGGTNYILFIALSVIVGFILLVGMNLNRVADLAEKVFSPIAAVAMLAFRQMSAQKTRSILTFGIFAVILTLNIFLASWAYSDRYGSTKLINAVAADSDVLVIADQPIPTNFTFAERLENDFSEVTFARGFTRSAADVMWMREDPDMNDPKVVEDYYGASFVPINNQTLWDENGEIQFNFQILTNKTMDNYTVADFSYDGEVVTSFEQDNNPDARTSDDSNLAENEVMWKALAENVHLQHKVTGEKLPMVFLQPIYDPFTFQITTQVGDSIWLPLTNGTLREYVVAGLLPLGLSNPVLDTNLIVFDPGVTFAGGSAAAGFVAEEEAKNLAVFNKGGVNYLDQQKIFLTKTSFEIDSEENNDLANRFEEYGNGEEPTSFRSQVGTLYGIISVSVYSLYEVQFDAQFKFFSFIQLFVNFGFLIGVLGLLVVSVRSVQERKREIGMMRSIGLKKHEVVVAIILELSVMGMIGLVIALLAGNALAYGLVRINSGGLADFLIPWHTIAVYTLLTFGAAFLASVIPGRTASKIPPSEALRYVG